MLKILEFSYAYLFLSLSQMHQTGCGKELKTVSEINRAETFLSKLRREFRFN